MDITKRLSVLLITAITAVSLVPCGKDTSSEVSSVTNAKASAWDSLDISKRYFVYLAKLRLYSEDRYCKFRNLYNIEDYSNELLIANYNISFLQDYLSRDYIWW